MRPALLAAGLCLAASAADAQHSVSDATLIAPPIRLASVIDEPTHAAAQPPVIPNHLTAKSDLTPPRQVFGPSRYGPGPDWKPSFIKGGRASVSYVPGDVDGLDWTTVDLLLGLKRPKGRLFSISPHFAAHWTNGPNGRVPTGDSDLPGSLMDASVDLNLAIPFSRPSPGQPPEWLATLAVSPGWHSDGENTSGDAFRLPGRAMLIWNRSPEWSYVVGAVVLDREDVPVLPAVGTIWTPTPNLKIDLLMPRPQVAYRFQQRPTLERWATLSGELGGGQWAIRRADGSDDIVRMKATNLLFGIETRTATGITWRSQFGAVVGRELEYDSGVGNRELGSTAIFRMGAEF